MKLPIRKKLDLAVLLADIAGRPEVYMAFFIAALCLIVVTGMKMSYPFLDESTRPSMQLAFAEITLIFAADVYFWAYDFVDVNALLRSSPYGRYVETILPSHAAAFILLADMLIFAAVLKADGSDKTFSLILMGFIAAVFETAVPYILKKGHAMIIFIAALPVFHMMMKNLFFVVDDISFSLPIAVIVSAVLIMIGAWAGGKTADKFYLIPAVWHRS